MGWLRDVLKALGWAVAAAGVSIASGLSGLVSGLWPNLLPLAVAPLLAFRWHHSGRVAGLVAVWALVLGGAAVLFLLWVFRDFQFRAPGR